MNLKTTILKWLRISGLLLCCGASSMCAINAQEIEFVEDFALAEDRTQALEQLVPGTEDYFYFHCLYYQHTEQFDKVDELLKTWIRQHGETHRVLQIKNRQALLTYEITPASTLEHIRDYLNLHFEHQRRIPTSERQLPTQLDSQRIAVESLVNQALQRTNTDGFQQPGLRLIAGKRLNPTQRRHLLQRLEYPDIENLPELVAEDLKTRDAAPFGDYTVHSRMTRQQLDELLTLRPELKNEQNFVNAYLAKLSPDNDTNLRLSLEARQAHLDRVTKFVQELGPTHNSLKANLLFEQLKLNLRQGNYDRELFVEYLKLPRQVFYINRNLLQELKSSNHLVDLNQDNRQRIGLPPIRNDEALIRQYLMRFLKTAGDYNAFLPWVADDYLKRIFAETKIVHGLGDRANWAGLLSPEEYKALLERVDLEFAPTNAEFYNVDEQVTIDLFTKNVQSLIVKVFRINTENYYRQYQRRVNTDIKLDGLVANHEQVYTYDDPPLRRVKRTFQFPEISEKGVYVVDFIGNGKSSRALIRKGHLEFISKTTAAGELFAVLDENKQHVEDATIWLGGKNYTADDDGFILVPFSTQPGNRPLILNHDGFSVLTTFAHPPENYQLNVAFYVDQESLVRASQAQLVLRPQLSLNGMPVSLDLLKEIKLQVQATTLDGSLSTKTYTDIVLNNDAETAIELMVPERLSQLNFNLSAKIDVISRGSESSLTAADQIVVNQIEATDHIQDVHLVRSDQGYFVEIRGKSGEPVAHETAAITLHHQFFTKPVRVTLQSDDAGRMKLGELPGILTVEAQLNSGIQKNWTLPRADNQFAPTLHAAAGESIKLPMATADRQPTGSANELDFLGLFEIRQGSIVADHTARIELADGFASVDDLEPGDYELVDHLSGRVVTIRVGSGEQELGYVIGQARNLQLSSDKLIQIQDVQADEDQVKVRVANANAGTRIHVIATRFLPTTTAFDQLQAVQGRSPEWIRRGVYPSAYVAGRQIGDEYRYILDRRQAEKYPGNMLTRPSLLLNPWALRETDSGRQEPEPDSDFAPADSGAQAARQRGGKQDRRSQSKEGFSSFDFLAENTTMLLNLRADEQGWVEIDRDQLAGKQFLQILVDDPTQTAVRQLALPESELVLRDLRLEQALDPSGHFTLTKSTSHLKRQQEFVLSDLRSGKFEQFDDLSDVYRLLLAISENATLREFAFVLDWPNKSDEEKRELYSKYACHELHFFLHEKDPEFFQQVVAPYLKNKRDKTFLDWYLLGEDLTPFAETWEFDKLNVAEQICLATALEGSQANLIRHIQSQYQLSPTDVTRFDLLFGSIFAASGLDAQGDAVKAMLHEEAEKQGRLLSDREMPGRPRPNSAPQNQFSGGIFPGGGGRGGGGLGGDESGAARRDREMRQGEAVPPANTRDMPNLDLLERKRAESEEDARQAGQDKSKAMPKEGDELIANELKAGRAALNLEVRNDQNWGGDRAQLRKRYKELYRRLQPTQEWVETNYYQLPITEHTADRVAINRFWRDYATRDPQSLFLSPYFAEASGNFTEMMLALAVIDLPFDAPQHDVEVADNQLTFKSGGPAIIFHQQIRPAILEGRSSTILISENFFRNDDRYIQDGDRRHDKFVTDEFLTDVVYGAQVVITNPTSTPQQVELLLQIPAGALPVANSKFTKSQAMELDAFSTQTLEYKFYFPFAGDYEHFPAHVSQDDRVVALAGGMAFNVVDEPSEIDRSSWAFLSQNGSDEEVIEFLERENLLNIDLSMIAFRMKDKRFFDEATRILKSRFVYDPVLWSYAVKHNAADRIREFLSRPNKLLGNCGRYISTPLLSIDPVRRYLYEQREFWPLVNARVHQLGERRHILNSAIHRQYHQLMWILADKPELNAYDHLAVCYYLLLQDRIREAIQHFDRVAPDQLESKLQYDYCQAYLAMYRGDVEAAHELAAQYQQYPVERWRNLFAAVLAQVEEIRSGSVAAIADQDDQAQRQTELAAQAPSFEFEIEGTEIKLDYQNLTEVEVRYYLMDIELLFSRNPFVQQQADGFAMIHPNQKMNVPLDGQSNQQIIEIPSSLHNQNVLVEISSGDQNKSQAWYANSLSVQVVENYGQLQVTSQNDGKALPQVYVKVYAKQRDGNVQFYKDGYTDLRGRFDYASLSNQQFDRVTRFAILVLSEENGAVIREASIPVE